MFPNLSVCTSVTIQEHAGQKSAILDFLTHSNKMQEIEEGDTRMIPWNQN